MSPSSARPFSAQVDSAEAPPGRFRTLQYQPTGGEHFYHVLFGHVPRYQMDFILRPELPSRSFRPQHFAHLGPLIKFLAPPLGMHYAVAIGNLSSNDTQHVPGRGGLAVSVSTRVADLRDHAQRESPVFAHSLVVIDEPLGTHQFAAAVETFAERVLTDGVSFYHGYYASGQADNFERVFHYVRSLRELPAPTGDSDPVCHVVEARPPYNQLLIDCRSVDMRTVLHLAARLAVILYRTNLKWTTITTGSEEFEPRIHQGEDYSIAIRLLCGGSDVDQQSRAVPTGSRALCCEYDELATSDEELGASLFGLGNRQPELSPPTESIAELQLCEPEPKARMTPPPLPAVLRSQPSLPQPRSHTSSRPAGLLTGLIGVLLGVLIGGLGVYVGLRANAPQGTARPVGKDVSVSPESARPGGSVPAPAPEPAPAPVPSARGEEQLGTHRLVVDAVRRASEPLASYAEEMNRLVKERFENGKTKPLERLLDETRSLAQKLEKLNRSADAMTSDESKYRAGLILHQYCSVKSEVDVVDALVRKNSLPDFPKPPQPER
ncbi:MAG: hypothetical protein JNM83_19950 [Myxococcales bacterium]|jgi:hypothetical protein|nr:hypothetical protein [Myxococcales bacterium]